jgi:hypothetical protein
MKRLLVSICVLAFAALSMSAIPKPSAQKGFAENSLVIFLTGNDLGQLKPCGCAGGQLGGLDRRLAVFDTIPKTQRLLIHTGSFIEKQSQQDLIKFNIIVRALAILGYDVVNLDAGDVDTAEKTGLLDAMSGIFNVLNSHRPGDPDANAKFTKTFSIGNKKLAVTIAAFDASNGNTDGIYELFDYLPKNKTANILILNQCDEAITASIAEMGIVDAVICPTTSDKPMIIGNHDAKPLVFSVGLYGRYITKLTVTVDVNDKLDFNFSDVPVTEDLPQQKELVELYKSYQGIVKEAGLLEKTPKYQVPDSLEYIGTHACAVCHEHADEYDIWQTKPHSDAFNTLEKVGSQFDPECIVCHTVGMEYKSGYINEKQSDYLKNNGCENCHGPGSEHLRTLGKTKMPDQNPKAACLSCHTPDHSGEFAGKMPEYFEKIKHWKEQNIADEVKIGEQNKK